MRHLSPRVLLSAGRANSPAIIDAAKAAWPRFLRVLAVGSALLLAGGVFCHAGESASVGTKVSTIPIKAPARSNRPTKASWPSALKAPARTETTSQPYTADVAWRHLHSLSLDATVLLAASIYIGIDQWGWGETGFHFHSEGWFGKSTAHAGSTSSAMPGAPI
jgi:hypothetical protein